ncbi:hypothetical protein DRF59_20630 [Chryseobacterium flavum]|uniref:Uncharacterized protein n=1 Tax=Chryseobacterium flavum TaxID=415851 RepID=A0A3D9CFE4_9FLAO|nr:hypothetical protein [Chryseobacterium flavum]REC64508.1 hypothetical protein DRF59_20630 [Chryseobacterium flavum]
MSNLSIIDQRKLDYLKENKDFIFINFDNEYSIKIIPFYNGLRDKQKLIELFNQLTNLDIRVEDLLGKLHLVILKILINEDENPSSNDIIINSNGLSQNSIQFLIDNLNTILARFKNRNIYILENTSNDELTFSYSK